MSLFVHILSLSAVIHRLSTAIVDEKGLIHDFMHILIHSPVAEQFPKLAVQRR
jgi:hypothetical protein